MEIIDNIFNNDPIYIKSLVGKNVVMTTVDNNTHNGTVYVIDPIYKTVALIKENNKLELILFHAIKTFTVLPSSKVNEFSESNGFVLEDLKNKKSRLKKWLNHMSIDVYDDGKCLNVEDHLIILPPYEKNDCKSENIIVLERIRNVIGAMPPDFK